MNLYGINITFAEKDHKVAEALKKHFSDTIGVEVVRCDISQISNSDCIVAPGNSYGLMIHEDKNKNQGNTILKTVNLLLNNIEPRVKNIIDNIYYGEQPVGTSFLVETNDQRFKYMAYTPIMCHKEDISESNNAYISFRSLLVSILNHNKVSNNKIQSILCSSFCTGLGSMDPEKAARQMRVAYGLVDINLNCSVESANMIKGLL